MGGRAVLVGPNNLGNPAALFGRADINGILQNFVEGFTERLEASNRNSGGAQDLNGLISAMDSGFQRLAHNASGITDQQRQQIAQQGQGVTQYLARLVASADAGPAPAPFMNFGMNGPFAFGYDPAAFAEAFGGNNAQRQEQSGVPEAAARRFCEEHAIEKLPEGVEKGEDGWMCPICYLGVDADKLVLLCEGDGQDGNNGHVYHQNCAVNWLSRKNSCPFCRRTPVVPVPTQPAIPQVQVFTWPPPFTPPVAAAPAQQADAPVSED